MKSKINRVLICLLATIPITVWFSSFIPAELSFVLIPTIVITFIGLWKILTPREIGKEGE